MEQWRMAAALGVGYLLGCVLTACVVSRVTKGRSAFSVGDGNPGMANMGASLGPRVAALVLAGDVAKVVVAVLIAWSALGLPWVQAAALGGVGATLGHDFPFWHRFRGGKGVATTCAALILMDPVAGIASCLVGLGSVVVSGYLCWGAVVIPLVSYLWWTAMLFSSPSVTATVGWGTTLVLLATMMVHHGPAIDAIGEGTTPRAALAEKLRARLGRKG